MEFTGRKETSVWVGERQSREKNGGWVNMAKFHVIFLKVTFRKLNKMYNEHITNKVILQQPSGRWK